MRCSLHCCKIVSRVQGAVPQQVSTEIRSLDSDMQMLVYENYNKFISATDTIRSMKSNVDGMDSNMQELQNIVGALESLCSSIKESMLPLFG